MKHQYIRCMIVDFVEVAVYIIKEPGALDTA